MILGYLDDEKCTQTWHTFLEESVNLQEHRNLLKHKKRCTTNVRGESLLDILKAYCALKSKLNMYIFFFLLVFNCSVSFFNFLCPDRE